MLGIMQPYFFPYLGYFDLINYTNRWIVFDTVQYIYHGWMNRNRVLHHQNDWQYINVPIKKHSRSTCIKDIEIANADDWKISVFNKLQHYKNKAPYYKNVNQLLQQCLSSNELFLSKMNLDCLKIICNYLEISFQYEFLSSMNLNIGPVNQPGDWALEICKAMGAEEYVNLPGGASLFSQSLFESAGIKLTLRNIPPLEYRCKGYCYIPNLSIIDLLMWNSPDEIKRYLDSNK